MALTRIDYGFVREAASLTTKSELLALNPAGQPGSMLMVGATGGSTSLKAEIAVRLALQKFVNVVLDKFGDGPPPAELTSQENLAILEAAFREANRGIFQVGVHKDREWSGSSLLAVLLDGENAFAGRIGDGAAYLFREGELFPFFPPFPGRSAGGEQGLFLGSSRLVNADMASVAVREADVLLLLSASLDGVQEEKLSLLLSGAAPDRDAAGLACRINAGHGPFAFCQVATIGPDAIYLRAAV